MLLSKNKLHQNLMSMQEEENNLKHKMELISSNYKIKLDNDFPRAISYITKITLISLALSFGKVTAI